MDDKIHNREIAEKIASVPFWRQEYFPKYFQNSLRWTFLQRLLECPIIMMSGKQKGVLSG